MTERTIRLKCRYAEETRVVQISEATNYIDLRNRLNADFGFETSLKYEDEDGDMITLSCQNDFMEMILSAEKSVINVIVSVAMLPNLRGNKGSMQNQNQQLLQQQPQPQSPVAQSPFSPKQSTFVSPFANLPMSSHSNMRSSYGLGTPSTPMRFRPGTQQRNKDNNHQQQSQQQVETNLPLIESNNPTGLNNNAKYSDDITRWKRGEVLGQGAFGIVYLGLNNDTGELMAVKQMGTEEVSAKELKTLKNEIDLLRKLQHPNIVRYIGTEVTPSALSIFLEYIPGGSLKGLIEKFGYLEEPVVRTYSRQLLLGLEYLHRSGIAHRDIKGANCLVGNDGVIKLADFGASKTWRSQASVNTSGGSPHSNKTGEITGTPSWMAPEVIRDAQSDKQVPWKKADIWSLGCTVLEMTTGKPPWHQFNNQVTVLYHIACSDIIPDFPENPSEEMSAFLSSCLQREPSQRLDATSLLLFPFVAAGINVGRQGTTHGIPGTILVRPTTVSTETIGETGYDFANWRVDTAFAGSRQCSSEKVDRSKSNEMLTSTQPSSPSMLTANTNGILLPPEVTSIDNQFLLGARMSPSSMDNMDMDSVTDVSNMFADASIVANRMIIPDDDDDDNDAAINEPFVNVMDNTANMIDAFDVTVANPSSSESQLPQLVTTTMQLKGVYKATGKLKNVDKFDINVELASKRDSLNRGFTSPGVDDSSQEGLHSDSESELERSGSDVGVSSNPTLLYNNVDWANDSLREKQNPEWGDDPDNGTEDRNVNRTIAERRDIKILNLNVADAEVNDPDRVSPQSLISSPMRSNVTGRKDGNGRTVRGKSASTVLHHSQSGVNIPTIECALETPSTMRPSASASTVGMKFQRTYDRRGGNSSGNHNENDTITSAPGSAVRKQSARDKIFSTNPDSRNNGALVRKDSAMRKSKERNTSASRDISNTEGINNNGFTVTGDSKRVYYTGSDNKKRKEIKQQSARVSRSSISIDSEDEGSVSSLTRRSASNLSDSRHRDFSPIRRDFSPMRRDFSPTRRSKSPTRSSTHLVPMNVGNDEFVPRKGNVSAISKNIDYPASFNTGDAPGSTSGRDEPAWLMSTGDHTRVELDGHTASVTKLFFPKKTNLILSSSMDGTMKLWGKDGGACVATFDSTKYTLSLSNEKSPSNTRKIDTAAEFKGARVQNAWADDLCESVWASCADGCLKVWGGTEGKQLRILKGHEGSITVMEGISASDSSSGGLQSNTLVATGAKDQTIRIWDHRAKKAQSFLFRGHSDSILSLRWAESGRVLLSGSKDKSFRIWDTRAGRMRSCVEKHFGAVTSIRGVHTSAMSKSRDSAAYITTGRDSMLHFWNMEGECVGSITAHRGSVNSISGVNSSLLLSPLTQDTNVLLSSGGEKDPVVKMWDTRKLKLIAEIPAVGACSKLVWTGQTFVSVSSATGAVKAWNYVPRQVLAMQELQRYEEMTHLSDDVEGKGGASVSMNNSSVSSSLTELSSNWTGYDLTGGVDEMYGETNIGAKCTDIVQADRGYIAAGFKSGKIITWSKPS